MFNRRDLIEIAGATVVAMGLAACVVLDFEKSLPQEASQSRTNGVYSLTSEQVEGNSNRVIRFQAYINSGIGVQENPSYSPQIRN
jgi:hypothetical protein